MKMTTSAVRHTTKERNSFGRLVGVIEHVRLDLTVRHDA